jgi:hypothetical protein
MSSIGRTAARDTRSPKNSCRFGALGDESTALKYVKNSSKTVDLASCLDKKLTDRVSR